MKRNPIRLLLAGILLLAPIGAAAQERPPSTLHMVGDHWTAWDPPQSFPEGAEVYTIERGDTLWDLANRFYGDPYLWPQIWERNMYIVDAHWIYPGDPLLLSLEVTAVDTLTELGEGTLDTMGPDGDEGEADVDEDGILDAGAAGGAPQPLGSASDIYCSGFIGEMDETFPYQIVGSEYGALLPSIFRSRNRQVRRDTFDTFGVTDSAKFGLDTGDLVYLDGGRDSGLLPGDTFTVVSARQKIEHPVQGGNYGRLYRYQGRVRVLSVQRDTAMGEIVHTCEPIHVGYKLFPFRPEPVPLGRNSPLWPVNLPVETAALHDAPVVLHSNGDIFSLGQDHVVYLDLGANDDVIPGDVFTVYRMNRQGLPPLVVGEVAILSVHDRSSVARITKSRRTIYLGDRLVLK